MKIAHWAKFYPPEWGGMERVTRDLATGMAELGMRTIVIAFARDPALSGDGTVEGVRVVRAPLLANPANQPMSFRWVWGCIRHSWRSGAVIIHAPNLMALLPLAVLMLFRPFGIGPRRRLLVWHSDIVGKGWLGLLVRPAEELLARLSTVIVATSPPYAEASAVLRRHRRKVRIVPLGIDPPDLPPPELLPEMPPLPERLAQRIAGRPLILSIGRLVPYKGFDTLIRAVASLEAEAVCVIVGTGPERQALEELARRMGVADRVLFAGSCSGAELAALFRHARLYAMSSSMRSEAFGVVLLEAMSHGLPIVACDIAGSGVPWVARQGENALIVPPGDAAALDDALSALLGDKALSARLGAAGKRGFAASFTKAAMVRGYLEALAPVSGAQPAFCSSTVSNSSSLGGPA